MPGHYGHSKAAEMTAKKRQQSGQKNAGAKAMKAATLALSLIHI